MLWLFINLYKFEDFSKWEWGLPMRNLKRWSYIFTYSWLRFYWDKNLTITINLGSITNSVNISSLSHSQIVKMTLWFCGHKILRVVFVTVHKIGTCVSFCLTNASKPRQCFCKFVLPMSRHFCCCCCCCCCCCKNDAGVKHVSVY